MRSFKTRFDGVCQQVQPVLVQTGTQQDFIIPSTQSASFIIDFDLRRSIRSPGNSGNYQFQEVMSLVTASEVGGFRGTVEPVMLTNPPSSCSDAFTDTFNAAYVFVGHDVTPSDINQLDASTGNIEPITTTSVNYDSGSDLYVYEAAFLPAGDYTVAVTCNTDQEDLEGTDNLQFFDIQNVTVMENDIVFL